MIAFNHEYLRGVFLASSGRKNTHYQVGQGWTPGMVIKGQYNTCSGVDQTSAFHLELTSREQTLGRTKGNKLDHHPITW